MTAAYSFWGNMGNAAYAVPLDSLTPAAPTTQGYTMAWNLLTQAVGWAPLSWDFASGDASSAGNWNVAAGKVYKINAIQVVGARDTGWTASTGTPLKSTFDTGTVTLAQLAGQVMALKTALLAHGLIGA